MAGLLDGESDILYGAPPPLERLFMMRLYVLLALLVSWIVGLLAIYGAFSIYSKYIA